MRLFLGLAGVAFTLALTGLFAVVAYSVAQRHHEMAVRLALVAAGLVLGTVRDL